MAKKQEVTLVSNLCAVVTFSAKANEKTDVVDGFRARITFSNETAKMLAAVRNTVVAVQNRQRAFYAKHNRWPFQPGKVVDVDETGTFVVPVDHMARLEEQAKAGTLSISDKIRMAKLAGLEYPPEWDQQAAAESASPEEPEQAAVAPSESTMKYPAGSLDKLAIARLRALAQDEELEGYDDLTAGELREELYLIEAA